MAQPFVYLLVTNTMRLSSNFSTSKSPFSFVIPLTSRIIIERTLIECQQPTVEIYGIAEYVSRPL